MSRKKATDKIASFTDRSKSTKYNFHVAAAPVLVRLVSTQFINYGHESTYRFG